MSINLVSISQGRLIVSTVININKLCHNHRIHEYAIVDCKWYACMQIVDRKKTKETCQVYPTKIFPLVYSSNNKVYGMLYNSTEHRAKQISNVQFLYVNIVYKIYMKNLGSDIEYRLFDRNKRTWSFFITFCFVCISPEKKERDIMIDWKQFSQLYRFQSRIPPNNHAPLNWSRQSSPHWCRRRRRLDSWKMWFSKQRNLTAAVV